MKNKILEKKINEMQENIECARDDIYYNTKKATMFSVERQQVYDALDYIFTYISFLEIAVGDQDNE